MSVCKRCPMRESCHTLPRYCLLLNYVGVVALLGTLGYLFLSGLKP
jgi:hypothetical protein